MMKYKGFEAEYEYDQDANIYHGTVVHSKDVITFQSQDESQLQKEFQISVDDYLSFCNELKERAGSKEKKLMTHEEMKAVALTDPEVRHHYLNPDEDVKELRQRLTLQGTVESEEDIVSPLPNEWEACKPELLDLDSFKYFLLVDLEATCCDKNSFPRDEMEIIEIGAVLVDVKTLEPLREFTTFIKPVRHPRLTNFCTELTTITQNDVDNALPFVEAIKVFKRWFADVDSYAFCSWGMYDKRQFEQDCRYHNVPYPFTGPHCNIKWRFSQAQGIKKQYGMKRALRRCKLELSGQHHRGIDDARNMVKMLPWITGRKKL